LASFGTGIGLNTIKGAAVEISPFSWMTLASTGPGRNIGVVKRSGYLRHHPSGKELDDAIFCGDEVVGGPLTDTSK
jgi:hypothetical protein